MHTARVALLIGFFSAAAQTAAAASAPLDLTELLATGDPVGRLGRIGAPGLRLHGIGDDGKVLVGVQLSDGRFGLVLADGKTIVPLWLSHTASGPTPDPWFASIEPSGRVIATTQLTASTQIVYEVTAEALRRIAGPGDVDSDGRTLCGFYAPRVNATGAAAFYASHSTSGDCAVPGGQSDRAIYTTVGGLLRQVAGDGRRRLLGIADDGTVLVSAHLGEPGEVTRWHDGQNTHVVGDGDLGPRGFPLRRVIGMNASRTGEVLFSAIEDERPGLYRTEQGQIVRVMSLDDQPPIGLAIERLGTGDGAPPAVNEHGDVVVTAPVRFDDAGNGGHAVLLYPAAGAPQVLMVSGPDSRFGPRHVGLFEGNVGLNANRQAVFSILAYGGTSSALVLRWHDGVLDRMLGAGDAGPDDTVIAAGGMQGSMCLAPDGSVAVSAEATNGRHGLACADASGLHLIAQSGETDSAGRELDNFGYYEITDFAQCAFAARQLLFNGAYLEPGPGDRLYLEPALYRAHPDRIDRLIGSGDRIGGLTVYRPDRQFAANAAGHLVTSITSQTFERAVVLLREEQFEILMPPYVLPAGDPHEIGGVLRHAITDHDVVALIGAARWPGVDDSSASRGEGNVLLLWENGALRVLADGDDVAADGAPYGTFSGILARGNRIAFAASLRSGAPRGTRIFLYEPDGGAPRLVYPIGTPEPGLGSPQLIDMAANGTILLREGFRGFRVTPEGVPDALMTGDIASTPFALNDAGNIAVISYESSLGGQRRRVLLAGGGGAAASCLDPSAPVTPTPTVEPFPRPAGTAVPCLGDCDGDGQVTIDELLRSVRCMIGIITEPPACNDCGIQRINEMIAAVNNALNGCPSDFPVQKSG